MQDDKEFVWLLWKELQRENPDITSTVDMIITRQPLLYMYMYLCSCVHTYIHVCVDLLDFNNYLLYESASYPTLHLHLNYNVFVNIHVG